MKFLKSKNERKFKKADTSRKEAVSNAGRELRNGKSSGSRVLNEHKKSIKKK